MKYSDGYYEGDWVHDKREGRENFYGEKMKRVVIFLKGNGKMMKKMEKEYINIVTVIYMRANGKMMKWWDKRDI